ncbi:MULTISPECIES: type IV pilus secretin PilQ [unclassified Ketobacter]|uniref:type IV pilus secretin PilQ n=1 Tax=unclassified Ketobacter TaxID=2639109 RepID=UPI000F276BED|nr:MULTISPECIES: type IV pilus secretin PilQ family protein [unclassified Ketobacter]MCK5791039.1 type IV pilus secretin PilQ family protein [Ketobacter sp.]RLT87578.1 MAG: type IV pilus secretin PilQ family protein [Ketobacter sp. GenoA1]RLT92907.1 MAG: type IV pilus secretin PilQ family protein [Ketobacter sp.]
MKFKFCWGAVFALLSSPLFAATLTGVESAAMPGDAVEIKLKFDGAPPEPTGYTTDSPARIAIDLDGVTNGLSEKYHTLGNGNVRSMTVMGAGSRTRLIVNLTSLTGYSTKVVGNNLLLTVGDGEASAAAPAAQASITSTVSSKPVRSSKGVQEIDFRRGEQGEGQVIITLSDANAPIDLSEESGKIVADFVGVALPEQLQRRLDVVDFATPVKLIDASTVSGNARISVTPTGEYEYMAYQTDKQFTISVKPISTAELERKRKEKFQYTGEKLSLNFQDIEVRSVLQLIADFTELNLVASDTVRGRITLRLQNVPWDQALDLILKTKGLDKRKVGNVMLVAPADEIAAREKLELESQRQVKELAPLRTEYLTVNYAKASEVAELVTTSGFLSERGSITVDERTNVLLIQDTGSNIDEVRFMLEQLDIPIRQVMIEARIVIARSDAAEELGVQWGIAHYEVGDDSNTGVLIQGNRGGLTEALDDPQSIEFGDNSLSVDLGVAGEQVSRIALGVFDFGEHGLVDLELSALESDGRADIVSTPKVLTADQQTAKIQSGTEVPYQEASSSGATSTSFKEAVLSLEVTPQITPDGRIIMDLKVNQDSVGEIFNGVPSIDTNEIETSVVVDNGQTVVLGGVFRSEDVEAVVKTPFLGDLPVLGRLFRRTTSTSEKAELLVFITPRIVNDVLAAQ